MGYNEGGDPEAGVGVVEFRLLLNIELHVGIRQSLLIRTDNLGEYKKGEGGGEEEGRKRWSN